MCDEHKDFKDMKLFYRFRKDDGTFPLDNEAKVFMRGQRIFEKYVLHTSAEAYNVFKVWDTTMENTNGV